jgi:hypothetical protein
VASRDSEFFVPLARMQPSTALSLFLKALKIEFDISSASPQFNAAPASELEFAED